MALYLSNRDGNGKTDEEGHYKFPVNAFVGNVLNSADLVVTQQSPLALGVTVAPGQYRIPDTVDEFAYTGWNDTATNVTINTADPANPRISAIVLYVDKAEPTSATPPNNPGIVKLMSVDGTPEAVPTAPNDTTIQTAVGAGNPYIVIAHVQVNTAATTVSNSDITDQRLMVTVASNLVNNAAIQDLAISTSKIQDNAVATAKVANLAMTTPKIRPTYKTVAGNNGVDRQTFPTANTIYVIVGTSISYTSGPTTELLYIWGTAMVNMSGSVGAQVYLTVNGTQVGKSVYVGEIGVWITCRGFAYYEIPANTTITIDQRVRTPGTGGGSVTNKDTDQSADPSFGVQTGMIAFGR